MQKHCVSPQPAIRTNNPNSKYQIDYRHGNATDAKKTKRVTLERISTGSTTTAASNNSFCGSPRSLRQPSFCGSPRLPRRPSFCVSALHPRQNCGPSFATLQIEASFSPQAKPPMGIFEIEASFPEFVDTGGGTSRESKGAAVLPYHQEDGPLRRVVDTGKEPVNFEHVGSCSLNLNASHCSSPSLNDCLTDGNGLVAQSAPSALGSTPSHYRQTCLYIAENNNKNVTASSAAALNYSAFGDDAPAFTPIPYSQRAVSIPTNIATVSSSMPSQHAASKLMPSFTAAMTTDKCPYLTKHCFMPFSTSQQQQHQSTQQPSTLTPLSEWKDTSAMPSSRMVRRQQATNASEERGTHRFTIPYIEPEEKDCQQSTTAQYSDLKVSQKGNPIVEAPQTSECSPSFSALKKKTICPLNTVADSIEHEIYNLDKQEQRLPIIDIAAIKSGRKVQYRKTRVCPWYLSGRCVMGDQCNYAHTKTELRGRPDLTRTRMCPLMNKCTDGSCRFAHGSTELRATGAFFRTKLCKFWRRGSCPAGNHCRHAHGEEQLREPNCCGTSEPQEPVILSSYLTAVETPERKSNEVIPHSPNCKSGQDQTLRKNFVVDLSTSGSRSRTVSSAQSSASTESPHPELLRTVSDFNLNNGSLCDNSSGHADDLLLEAFTQILLNPATVATAVLGSETYLSDIQQQFAPSPSVIGPCVEVEAQEKEEILNDDFCSWPSFHCQINPAELKLKDILDLAVTAQDPDLLECSAKLLRASLTLKKDKQTVITRNVTNNSWTSLISNSDILQPKNQTPVQPQQECYFSPSLVQSTPVSPTGRFRF